MSAFDADERAQCNRWARTLAAAGISGTLEVLAAAVAPLVRESRGVTREIQRTPAQALSWAQAVNIAAALAPDGDIVEQATAAMRIANGHGPLCKGARCKGGGFQCEGHLTANLTASEETAEREAINRERWAQTFPDVPWIADEQDRTNYLLNEHDRASGKTET